MKDTIQLLNKVDTPSSDRKYLEDCKNLTYYKKLNEELREPIMTNMLDAKGVEQYKDLSEAVAVMLDYLQDFLDLRHLKGRFKKPSN